MQEFVCEELGQCILQYFNRPMKMITGFKTYIFIQVHAINYLKFPVLASHQFSPALYLFTIIPSFLR